jgi:hypothetical protein
VDLGQQDEPKPERDEVHAFDQSNYREEPWQHSSLRLGLAGDAAEEGIARYGVTDASPDGSASKRDAESEERRGQSDSVVSHRYPS